MFRQAGFCRSCHEEHAQRSIIVPVDAGRFPAHLASVLTALGIDAQFIAREVEAMSPSSLAKTANRSVVGVMNEFAFLADGYRVYLETTDLLAVAIKLADTPCGPLKGGSSVWALREVVAGGVG